MRLDLYPVRRIRLLKVSEPGEWVTAAELVVRYNNYWEVGRLSKAFAKVVMHENRLIRILDRLIAEGCYEYDPLRGYRFLKSEPNTENR